MMFENRHKHLVPPNDVFYKIRDRHRILLAILNFCCGCSGCLPLLMEPSLPQEETKLQYLEEIPCPTEIYFDSCSFALPNTTNKWTFISSILNFIGAFQLIFFIVHSSIYLRKTQLIRTFSIRTKRIQKAFFQSALAQVASPISVLLVPLFLLAYVKITRQYLQGKSFFE
uniref:7TM_GPCR_Srx domain-containing protein n=1 Tax=Caenorhabditis tropicalis TaxID=1561998 RepID=A0A1I7UXP7_9PELO